MTIAGDNWTDYAAMLISLILIIILVYSTVLCEKVYSNINEVCKIFNKTTYNQGERGEGIGLFITLVPNFYWILICWFIKSSVQKYQTLNVIYRRVNFVYHYCRCTSFNRVISYPFRSLTYNPPQIFLNIYFTP